jgi:FkbM family methyltransferase
MPSDIPGLSWRAFVRPGDIVFDVGANVGTKTGLFLGSGARVVCVEPQPDCVAALTKQFGGNPRVTIVAKGLAEKPGVLDLSICSAAHTISTFAERWKTGRFANYKWDKVIPVPVATLDELIQAHGVPRYCKVDVEGFELSVLRGLTRPVPLLSFEFAREFLDSAKMCVAYLQEIGFKQFDFALGENPEFVSSGWLGGDALFDRIGRIADPDLWGDIYAYHGGRLCQEPPVLQGEVCLESLEAAGLWQKGRPLRLHLGCAEQHLDGYLNLDYSPANHNVMKVRADAYANLLLLQFPPESVDEIRLHQVFEHFNRVTALAMLIRWHGWLKAGGVLRFETPDLIGCARALVSPDSPWKVKMGAVRHLAGDQAEAWAYHLDHWFAERYEHTLKQLGFGSISSRTIAWPHEPYLCNVEVTAKKRSMSPARQLEAADALLQESTIADNERPTYEVWTRQLRALLEGAPPPGPVNALSPDISAIVAANKWLAPKPEKGIGQKLRRLFGRTHPAAEIPLEKIHNFNQENRDQWVAAKAAAVPPGQRVLDVGAGTCPYRKLFEHCEYRSHDFKKYGGIKLGNTHDYGEIDYVSGIAQIPLPDAAVDVVLCTEVLEHVPEPIAALEEMARLLKPGGRLLLTAPLGSGLHQLPYHFYGGFTPEWYKHFAPKFGLRVVEITPNGGFLKLLAQECARFSWTFEEHRYCHGSNAEELRKLFGELLPRYLFGLDQRHFNPQFTVGYHVELVKSDPQIPLPADAGEGARRESLIASGSDKRDPATVVLFFTKDRPLQLDAALRSWSRHCRDAVSVRVKVLYKASRARLLSLYRQLIREHPAVDFVREQDFRRDVLLLLRGQEYAGFVVDDTIFIRDFAIQTVTGLLSRNSNALGFSLRLGRNTSHCYSLDQPQKLPDFQVLETGDLKYGWPDAEHDFGYPLELSSSVYRVSEMLPLLESLEFRNPNTLEDAMSRSTHRFRQSHPGLLCGGHSLAVSIPANKVQQVCENRAGANPAYSAEALARLFCEGQRIDLSAFDGFTPQACHQEVEFKLLAGAARVPLVSVVMPCYKQAQYLPEAVASVIAQTFKDWEIIIVNDGSPDDTRQVTRELIQKYPQRRIRLLEQKNWGLAYARNGGIRAAAGAYVLPLDADDKVEPTLLEKAVAALEAQPEIAIVYTDVAHFGATEKVIQAAEYDFAKLCLNNQLNYCSLFRREAWDQAGGYNGNMLWGYEDWDFWIGCGERGFVARRIPGPLLHYRVKSASMYTSAVAHDEELRARIVLNHPALFDPRSLLKARTTWSASRTPSPSTTPKVSVIVPTHNRPDRLQEALRSILDQTFQDFEIIVVNDNGVDVEHVIDRLAAKQRLVHLRHPANRGLAAARNTGLRFASGKYIAFLDDDDIFFPDHLETLVSFLETSDHRVAYTDAYRATEEWVDGRYVVTRRDVPFSVNWDNDHILVENFVPVLCFMHEHSCGIAAGDFDETLTTHEDWDYWIRLSRICTPVHIKRVTCEFRAGSDGKSLTASRRADFLRTARMIHKKHRAYAAGNTEVLEQQERFLFDVEHSLAKGAG